MVAQSLFDAHELVVFADAVGAAGATGFYKAGVEGHNEVGNSGFIIRYLIDLLSLSQ